jgi:hypothetical protein
VNSVEVIYEIIKKLNLYEYEFNLVSHKPRLNWRQEFQSFYHKLENVISGIHFDKDKLNSIKGIEFVDSKFIQQHTTPQEPLLSVSSLVKSKEGKEFHLPMMNLHFDYPLSIDKLKQTLNKIIGNNYVLLKTDRFYHIYGNKLLTAKEWKLWNLKFLMVDSMVSPRYIGHSLERGYNLLRINSTNRIKKTTPFIVSDKTIAPTDVQLFAIVKHGNQKRKGGEMYFHHVFEVEQISRNIIKFLNYDFDEEEIKNISMASILHDTIEDTGADYEDIAELTNRKVADLVKILSNDKRMPKSLREKEYLKTISGSNLDVQIIKLADILSNLKGIKGSEDKKWRIEFCKKCSLFLANLKSEIKELDEYEEALKIINEITKHNNV